MTGKTNCKLHHGSPISDGDNAYTLKTTLCGEAVCDQCTRDIENGTHAQARLYYYDPADQQIKPLPRRIKIEVRTVGGITEPAGGYAKLRRQIPSGWMIANTNFSALETDSVTNKCFAWITIKRNHK